MSELSPSIVTAWYRENVATYQELGDVVATTITGLLKSKKIDHLAVSTRTKALESVIEKFERKDYSEIHEMTDMTGARVITYVESDIVKICALIEKAFQVHPDKSIDKSDELRSDQLGYRSVHFICELGDTRTELPELAAFKGVQFEVQIRTVLQHAWAEIEHDRSYKFAGDLPTPIRRRLNLLAGMLEIVDREFALLVHEVDEYGKEIKRIAKSGAFTDVEVTSVSVGEYLATLPTIPSLDSGRTRTSKTTPFFDAAVGELNRFGVTTIEEFGKLLSPTFLDALAKHVTRTTDVGFVRKAMMYADIDRYFESAWPKKWHIVSAGSKALLTDRYGVNRMKAIFVKYALKDSPKLKSHTRPRS